MVPIVLLFATTPASRYVTAALLNLEPASGAAVFVGAGHLDNCVLKADGRMQRLCSPARARVEEGPNLMSRLILTETAQTFHEPGTRTM